MKAEIKTRDNGVDLFTPLKMGELYLKNRMVMAPLTRNRAGEDNVPQAINAEYYRQRASAGLIITEATQVSLEGIGYPATPGIHNRRQIDGWRQVTDAVHAEGGMIFLQIFHVGRISHPQLQPNGILPVAPSAIKPAGEAITYTGMQPYVTPRALELDEIPDIVQQFRKAAENAKAAGFDGIEIHAANGYLIDQFLRDGTNQRDDQYGGSIENRVRLLHEILHEVMDVWGDDRVGVRLSPVNLFNDISDSTPDKTFEFIVNSLNAFKLAYLHVIETSFAELSEREKRVDFKKLRECYNGIYMVNGGYDAERANAALAEGHADLVAFGALFLANPDLPQRFAQGWPLNTPNPDTFYGGDAHGYTDYPFYQESSVGVST